MANIINSAAFTAGVSRISKAPEALDGLARFALFHGLNNGQFTPAHKLLGAMEASQKGSDLFRAVADMLTKGLAPVATFDKGAFKARKGAEYRGAAGAEVEALAAESIPARIAAMQAERAAKKAEREAAKVEAEEKAAAEKAAAAAAEAPEDTAETVKAAPAAPFDVAALLAGIAKGAPEALAAAGEVSAALAAYTAAHKAKVAAKAPRVVKAKGAAPAKAA